MAAETPHKPTSWLHWVLLYPALATSLLGSLPTVWQAVKAWRLEVSYARVQLAEEQQRLWEKNLDCLSATPVYSVDLPEGVTVGVTLCPSGDVLLRYQSQWATVSYTAGMVLGPWSLVLCKGQGTKDKGQRTIGFRSPRACSSVGSATPRACPRLAGRGRPSAICRGRGRGSVPAWPVPLAPAICRGDVPHLPRWNSSLARCRSYARA